MRYTFFAIPVLQILLLIALHTESPAQDKWWKDKRYKTETKRIKFAECKKVFVDLSEALNSGNINYIIYYFGSEVYINFLEKEKGYYSPDQSRYIIENFLYLHPVHSFRWKLSNRSETYAFALGTYKFRSNGYINSYKISTSLKYINGRWLIEQIIVD